jgi:hypothetical protein
MKISGKQIQFTKESGMIDRRSVRRLLRQLYQRRAEVDSLIRFFEKYGRQAVRRTGPSKRLMRFAS